MCYNPGIFADHLLHVCFRWALYCGQDNKEVQGLLGLLAISSHEADQMGSEALDPLWKWDWWHCKLSSLHWQGPAWSGAWPWLQSRHGHGCDAHRTEIETVRSKGNLLPLFLVDCKKECAILVCSPCSLCSKTGSITYCGRQIATQCP